MDTNSYHYSFLSTISFFDLNLIIIVYIILSRLNHLLNQNQELQSIEDIKVLDGNILTKNELEELFEDERIINYDHNGYSGKLPDKIWWSIKLSDGTEINVYE